MDDKSTTSNDYSFHWLHPNAESRATGTHGDGLYAVRTIKAGECLLIFGGYILTVEQEAKLAGKLSDNGVQIAKNLVICSTRTREWGGGEFSQSQLRSQCRLHGPDRHHRHAHDTQGRASHHRLRDGAVPRQRRSGLQTRLPVWRAVLPWQGHRQRLEDRGAASEVSRLVSAVLAG